LKTVTSKDCGLIKRKLQGLNEKTRSDRIWRVFSPEEGLASDADMWGQGGRRGRHAGEPCAPAPKVFDAGDAGVGMVTRGRLRAFQEATMTVGGTPRRRRQDGGGGVAGGSPEHRWRWRPAAVVAGNRVKTRTKKQRGRGTCPGGSRGYQ
jgi:hypothetical protein